MNVGKKNNYLFILNIISNINYIMNKLLLIFAILVSIYVLIKLYNAECFSNINIEQRTNS